MADLNASVPADVMERVLLAKLLTKSTIREIVTEALEAWLRQHGYTPEKVAKLRSK